jgi:hypothetical protein
LNKKYKSVSAGIVFTGLNDQAPSHG